MGAWLVPADPLPLVEIETLKPPSLYPPLQLARVCYAASIFQATIGTARFVYALLPEDPHEAG